MQYIHITEGAANVDGLDKYLASVACAINSKC